MREDRIQESARKISDHGLALKYLKYLFMPHLRLPVNLPAVRVRRVEGPVELRPHQRSRADEPSSRHEEVVAVGVEGPKRIFVGWPHQSLYV